MLSTPTEKNEDRLVCIVEIDICISFTRTRVAQCVKYLDYLITHTNQSTIRRGFAPGFVKYEKGALDSEPQVIKLTSCLPMVGGSLRVLGLLPPLQTGRHDIAKTLLKVALNTLNQIKSISFTRIHMRNANTYMHCK